MATNNSGTLVSSTVRPFSSDDKFPVALTNEVYGAPKNVNTLTELNNIPLEWIAEGNLGYVGTEKKRYKYENGSWKPFSKEDVGLNNIDNTSDLQKVQTGPIKQALDQKLDASTGVIIDNPLGIVDVSTGMATKNDSSQVSLSGVPQAGFTSGSYFTVIKAGNVSFSGLNFNVGDLFNEGDLLVCYGNKWGRTPLKNRITREYAKLGAFNESEVAILNAIKVLDISVPTANKNDDWRICYVATVPTDPALQTNHKYRIQLRNLTTNVDFAIVNENASFDASSLNGIKNYLGDFTNGGITISYNISVEWKLLLDLGANFQYFNNSSSQLKLKVGKFSTSTDLINRLGNYSISDFDAMSNILREFKPKVVSITPEFYIDNNGKPAADASKTRCYTSLPIVAGQKIKVKSVINGSAVKLAVYINSTGQAIGFEGNGEDGRDITFNDYVLNPPKGAVSVFINGKILDNITVFTSEFISQAGTKSVQDSNTARISDLESLLKDYVEITPLTTPSAWMNTNGVPVSPSSYRKFATIENVQSTDSFWYSTTVNGEPVFAVLWFNASNQLVASLNHGENGTLGDRNFSGIITPPNGAVKLVINGNTNADLIIKKYQTIQKFAQKKDVTDVYTYIDKTNSKKGLEIELFGTSIPEAGLYPSLAAKRIGATMINKAIGSSTVRVAKKDGTVNGLAWQNVCYALAGTTAEKMNIINNWSTFRTLLQNNPPVELSTAEQTKIIQSSYEYILVPYLNGTYQKPDLFIFDHGRNDNFSTDTDSDFINVPANRIDRNTFIGAMNYLIDIIHQYDPFAKIAFFGHYENSESPRVSLAQQTLAEYWDYPLCRTWEKTGWTLQKVPNSKSYWSQLPWSAYASDQDTTQDMTVRRMWIPDNIHPHTATNGKPQELLTEIMYDFLVSI